MSCEHKHKKRIYPPFLKPEITYKTICSDCLHLIEESTSVAKKAFSNAVEITDDNRIDVVDLIPMLPRDKLKGFEETFVNSFAERLEQWGDNVNVSEKQQAILDKLQSKFIEAPKLKAKKSSGRHEQPVVEGPGIDNIPF